jgi:hypothetical protein
MACYKEKANGWEVNETSRVDLFAHPFRKLRIDPTATNKEIDEAVDLAREQQLASNEELAHIRESLFNPLGRLSLELSYPVDGTAVDVHAIYATLSSDASTGERLSFAERLPPLSRANFQAHIAAERPAECAVLRALVDSHACLDSIYAFEILKDSRKAGGNPAPSLANVAEGLQQLLTRHSEAAINSLVKGDSTVEPLVACTENVLDFGDRHQTDVLASLLAAYHQSTRRQRAERLQEIKSACQAIAARPELAAPDEFARTLTDWALLCRPLLLFSGHRETLSDFELPVDDVLALGQDLATGPLGGVALELTELTQRVLSSSPTAIKRLDEGKRLIENQFVDREMKPLEDFIDGFDSNFDLLIRSLGMDGFSPASTGLAKGLWDLFVQAAKATDRVRSVEPWTLVRDLALHLNDNVEQPRAASALIAGLIRHAETVSATSSLLSSLRQDLRVVQPERLPDNGHPKQIGRTGRFWSGRIALAAVCGAAALFLGFEAADRLWLKTASTTSLPAANPEIEPPVGTGQHFSLGNVRYCQFQKERLRIMKSLVRPADDIRAFNLLAADYNSRCSDFFFRDSDVAVVKAELALNRQRLANEAEKIMSTWPGRSAAPASSSQ